MYGCGMYVVTNEAGCGACKEMGEISRFCFGYTEMVWGLGPRDMHIATLGM